MLHSVTLKGRAAVAAMLGPLAVVLAVLFCISTPSYAYDHPVFAYDGSSDAAHARLAVSTDLAAFADPDAPSGTAFVYDSSAYPYATKGISRLPHGLSLDDLSAAARVYDRGGLTAAGRSLTKHGAGARSDSIGLFPQARGNPLQINEIAHTQVDDILTHPGSRVVESYSGRFGDTVQIIAPDGRGVVFDSSGTFLYFGEFPP